MLLGAWLLWMLLTAPARLLTAALPAGIGVGELAGTVWQGEARDIVWRGAGLAHLRWRLAFSGALPGWQISFSDPSGLRGQVWLQGLSALTLRDGRLIVPAGVAGRGLAQSGSVDAGGPDYAGDRRGALQPRRLQQISDGRARWQDATLSSPAGSLTLASVSGKFSCTRGALALNISQESHQLSLSDGHPRT
ncbi:Pectic enzymes secretion protein OUTN [Raoultella terrigena]|uniref:Type II secretion system protein N n=1 Tax=Raoultella terrigena TaxID=577 RepID=A0A4U9D831_RAOTE|nr:Pectic enzymes secretion protein OUTN [Raoultella terrigena]